MHRADRRNGIWRMLPKQPRVLQRTARGRRRCKVGGRSLGVAWGYQSAPTPKEGARNTPPIRRRRRPIQTSRKIGSGAPPTPRSPLATPIPEIHPTSPFGVRAYFRVRTSILQHGGLRPDNPHGAIARALYLRIPVVGRRRARPGGRHGTSPDIQL